VPWCQLQLVVAPKEESSMFSEPDLLLGQCQVFLDPDGTRLANVHKQSRSWLLSLCRLVYAQSDAAEVNEISVDKYQF
jgi:hypothetical protein